MYVQQPMYMRNLRGKRNQPCSPMGPDPLFLLSRACFPQSTLDTFSLCWRKMEQFLGREGRSERRRKYLSKQDPKERKKRKTWSVYGLPLFSVFHPPWWLRKHVVNNGSWGLYDIRVGGYDSTIFFTAMTLHARKMSEAKLCSYSEHLHLQAWLKCMLWMHYWMNWCPKSEWW